MQHALLIEKFDVNPLTVVGCVSVGNGVDARSQVQTALESYNSNRAEKAEGALLWSDTDAAQRYEFRIGDGLREERYGQTQKLVGEHTCDSGRKYWYFGKCVTWVPLKRTYWEVYVYHHDKKFAYDDVFQSKDLLVKLEEDLLRTEIDMKLLYPISWARAEAAIEEWDRKRSPAQ